MQALAIGKPLDKMQSVPEAAAEGEGLPSANQLLEIGYGGGQAHAQPDQGDKVRFVGLACVLLCLWVVCCWQALRALHAVPCPSSQSLLAQCMHSGEL